jgi:glycopeptide antibiotics resistance protein
MSFSRVRTVWAILAFCLLAFAAYGSFVPFDWRPVTLAVALAQFRQKLQEFSFGGSRSDWSVNVALFVPISFCLLCAIVPSRATVRARIVSIIVVAVTCVCSTLAIEFAQSWCAGRVTSVSDVFAQFVGTAIGIVAWLVAGRTATQWLEGYLADRRRESQLGWLLQAYLVGLAIYSVMPLDLTIRPAEIYRKYKAGRIGLVPILAHYNTYSEAAYEMVANAVLFVPVGIFSVIGLSRKGQRARSFGQSLVIGCGIVFAIEFAQIFVVSRFTDTTDLITGTLGVMGGILLTRWWHAGERSPESESLATESSAFDWRWFWFAFFYSLLLVFLFWTPFDFLTDVNQIRQRMDRFFSVPLLAAIAGDRFLGLSAIIRKFMFFAPLGACAVMATRRLQQPARQVTLFTLLMIVAILALGLELGQILLPAHVAAIDDVVLCFGAALVGALIAHRLCHHGRNPGHPSD